MLLPIRARLGLWLQTRNVALQVSSLEIEKTPYPDTAVFESMSEEYLSVHRPHHFTPLSSSETLASLVSKGDFRVADVLRKELITHRISIPRDVLYLRAAWHTITQRRLAKKGSAKERMDAFEAWLSLAPDRHETWHSFHDIRQRLFLNEDRVDLGLVYRFGLVLAAKGYYSGDMAMQVVSTLARCARPSVVERYLRQVEDASRDYNSKTGASPSSDWLSGPYSLCIRTLALSGKGGAALGFVSLAQSRGVQVSDFTLNIVARQAQDQQVVIDHLRTTHPLWTPQDTKTNPDRIQTISAGRIADTAELALRLRALRTALRSPRPPSPHILSDFVASYLALGRTRAVALLRALTYKHSPRSASTWAMAAMLHHRSHGNFIQLLYIFNQHFHLVGVPHKTLLSILRGRRGQQAQKDHDRRWIVSPSPLKEKLWPSAYHTALVWEAIMALSPKGKDKTRLYALLLLLVQRSRQPELDRGQDSQEDKVGHVRVELSPDTFDAAHFSPFVSSWARRRPVQAARVLEDMVRLGVESTVVQWSMVARGYAQHGDPRVALRILDQREARTRASGVDMGALSDALLGIHTNVLRGFVVAGDVAHAREVEKRLVERFGYKAGVRPATDAGIALLRELEERLDPE